MTFSSAFGNGGDAHSPFSVVRIVLCPEVFASPAGGYAVTGFYKWLHFAYPSNLGVIYLWSPEQAFESNEQRVFMDKARLPYLSEFPAADATLYRKLFCVSHLYCAGSYLRKFPGGYAPMSQDYSLRIHSDGGESLFTALETWLPAYVHTREPQKELRSFALKWNTLHG